MCPLESCTEPPCTLLNLLAELRQRGGEGVGDVAPDEDPGRPVGGVDRVGGGAPGTEGEGARQVPHAQDGAGKAGCNNVELP